MELIPVVAFDGDIDNHCPTISCFCCIVRLDRSTHRRVHVRTGQNRSRHQHTSMKIPLSTVPLCIQLASGIGFGDGLRDNELISMRPQSLSARSMIFREPPTTSHHCIFAPRSFDSLAQMNTSTRTPVAEDIDSASQISGAQDLRLPSLSHVVVAHARASSYPYDPDLCSSRVCRSVEAR